MATQAAQGQKALDAHDYPAAITHYTTALQSSPSPLWYTKRSIAHHRLGNYEAALHDAEDGVLAAISRGKRELIAAAQMRRAIALFSLKRFGDARLAFTWVRKLNEKEKGLGVWQEKCRMEFERLGEGDEGRGVVVKETPEKRVEEKKEKKKEVESVKEAEVETSMTSAPMAAAIQTPAPVSQTPKEKIRHEFYQSSTKVTITIFAKGVPKDKTEVEFGPQSLSLHFPLVTGSTYDFTLLPLYGPIDISQSSYNITPSKIEISLHKATPGSKWAALEGTETSTTTTTNDQKPTKSTAEPTPLASTTTNKAPSYPTSSRTGTKDWDAVAKSALLAEKAKSKAEHPSSSNKDNDDPTRPSSSSSSANNPATDNNNNNDDDYDDEDEEEGDPLNSFFKKLYKDATPDTRRAMMKSYIESNGTALSTNWEDVGAKTVETSPPEGMVARKWGE